MDATDRPLTARTVLSLWWPLAASWLMMGLELPLVNAAIARLPEERLNLAAYGSLVFPLSLLIEAPIIPLLAASTALSRDRVSYARLTRFMWGASATLTSLHALVAFTPLFDWIALDLFDMDARLVEPGRIGMQLMLPWTPAIAYRRFQQGLLIRSGHPRAVGIGTVVRLVSLCAVLVIGSSFDGANGIVVGSLAVALAVTAEAVYSGWAVRPCVDRLEAPRDARPAWSWRRFAGFYAPLVVWTSVGMVAQPLASTAIGRMPRESASFAVWPAVNNLVFLLRSTSFAFNEVVVATIGRPGGRAALSAFAWRLGLGTSGLLALVALTPLAGLWFGTLQDLDADLVELGVVALLFALPFPFAQARMSLYTGSLVHAERTRAIGESVLVFIVGAAVLLVLGVYLWDRAGVHQAALALSVAAVAQTLWLLRSQRRAAAVA